jgi:arylsulfatase A-like enzyme
MKENRLKIRREKNSGYARIIAARRLASTVAALGLLLIAHSLAPAAETTKKPNVVFLFADDQRADTIGALGNPHIKTPNLDQLVRSGFAFRNAYCLGSNVPAVCTPSRNMLLSGRAFFRWQGQQAQPEMPNFPTSMKAAGYETYHHGKRGNTSPAIQALFDHNKYVVDNDDRTSGEPCQTIVNEAIDFLKSRQQTKPVFMYLAFSNPHDPRVAAQKYMDLYERDKIPLPKNYKPLHPFNNGEQFVRDELLAPFPRTEDEVRKHLHDYYAVISAMDRHIGRLLAALKALGMYENTIFIYSADHGLAIGSHGLFGKQNLYEAGMKPPLIFAGPGIPKGQTQALVYLLDIFPTVCDLVGTDVPAGLDGKSLKPVIEGRASGVRDTLFLAYRQVQRAVRDDRWKMIRYPQVNITQLFDLKTDPDELTNLADKSEQAERIKSLTAEMERWQKSIGDTTPLVVDQPQTPIWDPSQRPEPPQKAKAKNKG